MEQVPVNPSVLGRTADSNRPEITQVIFKSNKGMERNDLERLLYVVRKKILKQTREEGIDDFYICSMILVQLFIKECSWPKHFQIFVLI